MSSRTLFYFFVVILISGCEKKGKAIKTYDLTIVVSDKLGDTKDAKYPETIYRLLFPIETAGDESQNFAPYPAKIQRLGLENGLVNFDIIPDSRKQKNYEASDLNNWVKQYFEYARIGYRLSRDNESDFDPGLSLTNFLKGAPSPDEGVFYFSDKPSQNPPGIKLISNIDSLIHAIKIYLVKGNHSKITVVVNPGQASEYIDLAKNDTLTEVIQRPLPVENKEPVALVYTEKKATKKPNEPSVENSKALNELEISLQDNVIKWTDMGDGFLYEVSVSSREGEGTKVNLTWTLNENTIAVENFKIRDNRRYIFTVKANSKKGAPKVKSTQFNLINYGSKIDPRCKIKSL